MSSGLGFFDSEGVWRFGEDDTETLFSDMLNIGQEAASAAFAVDRARLNAVESDIDSLETSTAGLGDTGWITPVLSGAWISTPTAVVQYRRLNRVVFLRGRPTSGATGTIFTLPAGFRPSTLGTTNFFLAQNGSIAGSVTQLGLSTTGDGVVSGVGGTAPVLTAIPPFIAES